MQQRNWPSSKPFALRKAVAFASSRKSVANAPSGPNSISGQVHSRCFASSNDFESRK